MLFVELTALSRRVVLDDVSAAVEDEWLPRADGSRLRRVLVVGVSSVAGSATSWVPSGERLRSRSFTEKHVPCNELHSNMNLHSRHAGRRLGWRFCQGCRPVINRLANK